MGHVPWRGAESEQPGWLHLAVEPRVVVVAVAGAAAAAEELGRRTRGWCSLLSSRRRRIAGTARGCQADGAASRLPRHTSARPAGRPPRAPPLRRRWWDLSAPRNPSARAVSEVPHLPPWRERGGSEHLTRKRDGQSGRGQRSPSPGRVAGAAEGERFRASPGCGRGPALARPWQHDLVAILDATATGTPAEAS